MPGHRLLVLSRATALRLSSRHLHDFLSSHGVDIAIELVEVDSADEVPALVAEKSPTMVRLDPGLSSAWLAESPLQPLAVSRMGAADFYLKTPRGWEPDLLIERALHDVIVRQGKAVNLHDWAYVIGEGAELRVTAGVCLGLGFRRLRLVSDRDADLTEQRKRLLSSYPTAEIVALPAHSLTLQTIDASILVNSLELKDNVELSGDLAYFNFMRQGGLIIDLKSVRRKNPVLDEAMRAGLRVIPPHEVTGAAELLVVKKLGLENRVSSRAYLDSWFEVLRQQKDE